MTTELYHHGIKGQQWGKKNGPPYPLGAEDHSARENKARWSNSLSSGRSAIKKQVNKKSMAAAKKFSEIYYDQKIKSGSGVMGIGRKHVDTFLESNTAFYRIQSADNFENFAFYATYKQHDINEYAGLFGKNLTSRANAAAKQAEKQAKKSGTEEDAENARQLRETANNMNVYQLKITNKERLKIPSDDNASRIVGNLLHDKDFYDDLKYSIEDSKAKMKRPSQQVLFNEALKSMNKDISKMTNADKSTIYKALNLSLTNHDAREVAMQDKFYGAMKKEGYSALLDLNDKSYSSYHAKSPVIVFDTDKVSLQSVTKMDPNKIEKLYKKHNTERILKDIPEQIVGNLAKYGATKVEKAASYTKQAMTDYLGGSEERSYE